MKKVLSVFLVLSLFFNIILQQPIFAAEDTTIPKILSIATDKKSIKGDDSVTFTAKVSDNTSVEEVTLTIRHNLNNEQIGQ